MSDAPFFSCSGICGTYVAASEVTTLKHELRNDSVELAALVAKALLSRAQLSEVLGRLRDYVVVEFEADSTSFGCTHVSNLRPICWTRASGPRFGRTAVQVVDLRGGTD